MTDKEKIIAYIDKLLEKYPKNYYLLTVAEFIDSMQEEPVSEKDKLRALSDGKQHLGWLDDANALEEPINKELDRFIKEHGPMATLEKCAAHFAEWGKKHSNLSVSDDLEEAAESIIPKCDTYIEHDNGSTEPVYPYSTLIYMFKAGAEWQKEQMLKDAVNVKINRDTLYDLKPFIHERYLDYKIGDKVKLMVIKED